MRKITSLILSLVILMTGSVFVYADSSNDSNNKVINENVTVEKASTYITDNSLQKKITQIEDKYDIQLEVDPNVFNKTKSYYEKNTEFKNEFAASLESIENKLEVNTQNANVANNIGQPVEYDINDKGVVTKASTTTVTKQVGMTVGKLYPNRTVIAVWVTGKREYKANAYRWVSRSGWGSKRHSGVSGTKWSVTNMVSCNKSNGDQSYYNKTQGTLREPTGTEGLYVISTGWKPYAHVFAA